MSLNCIENLTASERLLGPDQPNYTSESEPAIGVPINDEQEPEEEFTPPHSSSEDDSDAELDGNAKLYGVEPGRYIVLAGLALVNASNALMWMTFASIVTPAEQYYSISASQINVLNIIFAAMYSGLFWISGVVLPKTGLGWGLALCAALNVCTAVLRLASVWFSPTFGMILSGNIVGGLCQSLILSAPPMLSNQWFSIEERNFATGIGVSAQIFGGALGMLLPSNIVTEATSEKFGMLYYIQLGFAALGLIVTLLAKKSPSLPPTAAAFKLDENVTRRSFHHDRLPASTSSHNRHQSPPSQGALSATSSRKSTKSHSSQHQGGTKKYVRRALSNVSATLKTIVTNKNFLLILVVSGLCQGSIWTIGTLMVQVAQPFGVAQTTIGWIGFSGQLVGGFASVLTGGVLGFVKDYKPILVLLISLSALSCMIFPIVAIIIGDSISVAVSNALVALLYVGMCLFGVAQCPILFELGIEVTFPLSEEITSPLVMWTPSFLSLIFVTFQGAILTENPTHEKALIVLFINFGFILLSVLASLLLKPQYNRRVYEQNQLQAANEAKTGINA